jgi:hypothetical protein
MLSVLSLYWEQSGAEFGFLLPAPIHRCREPLARIYGEFAVCTERWSAHECLEALSSYVHARLDQAFEASKAVIMSVSIGC